MVQNAKLTLQVSLLDYQARQVSPVAPVSQGWSPTVRQQSVVTLAANDDTTVTVPDGATVLYLPLLDAINLTLKGNAADVGIPLCATTNPLNLPLWFPLGDGATVVIANGEDTDYDLEVVFL